MAKTTTLEERYQILDLAQTGLTDKEIAQQIGWSARTVRKWRRRGQRQGRAGLASQMGRPVQGALSTFSDGLQETLRRWREAHPGWGPQTLRAELDKHPRFRHEKRPAPSSIGRFLQEQGLSRKYERHSDLPESEEEKAEAAHEVWEMDARGHEYIPDVGVISLINLNDRFSHARLLSYPCWLGEERCQRHADTGDYQTVLRLAFTDWGRPQRLQVDRESVFYDNTSKSPFPTRLHLWLVALGVSLTFGRPHQATDQGMTERSHQLWAAQCLQGQQYQTWQELYLTLRHRRDFLNYDLPCASLDDQPPLQAHPEAAHSHRPYRPECEAELLDLSRVYTYLAQGRWFRLVSKDGTFSLGGHVYYIGAKWARQQVELIFDADEQQLCCHDEAGQLIEKELPIQGISVEALMGQLSAFTSLPVFQLALPFDWESQRVTRLFEIVGDMT
jgi:transposase